MTTGGNEWLDLNSDGFVSIMEAIIGIVVALTAGFGLLGGLLYLKSLWGW